jgi:PAS domain S-box-containing protein
MDSLPPQILAELYQHLPFLAVCLSIDGVVLHCNPETSRITGYPPEELVGKNFWGTLFPGRLFAQVPRFMKPGALPATPLLRDIPLTIRTRGGQDRIVAFTRFKVEGAPGDSAAETSGAPCWICIGVDLTDRLMEADKADQPPASGGGGIVPFGPQAGNVGAIDGEFVTPLAISPPARVGGASEGAEGDPTGEAIRQVHEFLSQMDSRMEELQTAFAQREMQQVATLAQRLHTGAYACGLLDFSARAERLQHAATGAQLDPLNKLIAEMLALYQPPRS